MYKKKLNFNDISLIGRYPQLNNQLVYLDNLKREIKGRQYKVANINYRKNLLQQQTRENYLNEIEKIKGELSIAYTRLPIGSIPRLERRQQTIKNLNII